MNTQLCKWLISIPVCLCLVLSASSALAKKPTPPPDPIDDGAACVDSGSDFPAFIYVEIRDDDEIYLSNAAGDCSISVYKAEWNISGVPTHLSYRYYGDFSSGHGTIVWSEQQRDDDYVPLPSKIQMLNFTISGGAVVESLPIVPTLLIQQGTLYAPDLSPEGERVLFTGNENDGLNYFIDEMIIDCAPDCRTRIFETRPDLNGDHISIHQPLYGLDGQRIYFEYGYPDRKLAFIAKDEDGYWPALDYGSSTSGTTTSDPVLILAHEEGSLGVGGIGYWDYDNDGFAEEVIAHPRYFTDYHAIEILDVEACVANEAACTVSRYGEDIVIEGRSPSFTTFTDNPPALLYTYQTSKTSGVALRELNLQDFTGRTLIEAITGRRSPFLGGVDSAD